jgi:hypothetical protein
METTLIIPSLLPIDLTASGRTRRNLVPIRLTRIAPGAYVESLAPIRALSWYVIFAQPRPDSALPSPLVVFHAELWSALLRTDPEVIVDLASPPKALVARCGRGRRLETLRGSHPIPHRRLQGGRPDNPSLCPPHDRIQRDLCTGGV